MTIKVSPERASSYFRELFGDVRLVHYNTCKSQDEQQVQRAEYWMIGTVARGLSYSVNVEKDQCDLVFSEEDGLFRYNSRFDYEKRREEIVAEIEKIAAQRDNFLRNYDDAGSLVPLVICFGEFDYPCFLQATKRGMDSQDPFLNKLQLLATKHDCLIVAGSYHQVVGGEQRNTALLFEPGKKGPVRHLKWRPAQKLKEQILHPKNNEVRYYKTKFGLICLLVCMDSYDVNLVTSIAQRSGRISEHLDLLLVPSFNASADANRLAVKACERLAYLTGATVVYVNSAQFVLTDVSGPAHLVMCPGEAVQNRPEDIIPNPSEEEGDKQPGKIRVRYLFKAGDNKISIEAVKYDYMLHQENLARETYPDYVKEALVGQMGTVSKEEF